MAGVTETFKPATDMFSGGMGNLSWLFYIVIVIGVIFAVVLVVSKIKKKKSQWTHTLKVRRVLQDGRLTDPIIHKMRRFPLIKKAEVFELEKPLLGGYLLPELDSYSGANEFSIILDNNNRIYTNKGEFFVPDKNYVNVSAKHSEIDIQRSNLKADFQEMNKTKKRLEWADIAKFAFMSVAVIAIMIVAIVGINNWKDSKAADASAATAEAEAMTQLARAMETSESIVNLIQLIMPDLKELKGTNNIQGLINNEVVE